MKLDMLNLTYWGLFLPAAFSEYIKAPKIIRFISTFIITPIYFIGVMIIFWPIVLLGTLISWAILMYNDLD